MTESLDVLRRSIDDAPLDDAEAVESFRIQYLGRKNGHITNLFKRISEVAPEERRQFGAVVNELKARAEQRIAEAETRLNGKGAALSEAIDLTLPGRRPVPLGSIHPLTQTLDEIKRVFGHFGFSVAEGPEIEDDWHNFSALNFPPDHPARDMQDTFWVETGTTDRDGVLLRTHTSPVQVRVMTSEKPPIRVIVPGRVYRNEAISYKSFCLFHQVEGLYVDEGVTLADLKQLLRSFAEAIFGTDVRMRFRPSFFPFTEPSGEVDIWWPNPALPEGGRWMEIMGCGMVDPNVFKSVDIDPERFTGYAFGMGVERITMIRHGIDDIRILYENDVRFLSQF